MNESEKYYDSECVVCGDRNYRELKSWIMGQTRYSFADRRNYIDLQNLEWKMKEIEAVLEKCHCDCPLCNKCDFKDGDE